MNQIEIDITNVAEYMDEIAKSSKPHILTIEETNKKFPYQIIPFNQGKIFFKVPLDTKPWNHTIQDAFSCFKNADKTHTIIHNIYHFNRDKISNHFLISYKVDVVGNIIEGKENITVPLNDDNMPVLDDLEYCKELVQKTSGIFETIRMAVSLMNMKNIEYVDEPNKELKEYQNKKKFKKNPKTIYKVLVIAPIKKILIRDGKIESNGVIRALHLCRGHIREYSEDKKLFGKISGRFWISPHTRGNKKSGEIIKDYKVLANAN